MFECTQSIVDFLLVASAQLLILGVIAGFMVRTIRTRGTAGYWIFGLVLLVPVLSLCSASLPAELKISLPWGNRQVVEPMEYSRIIPIVQTVQIPAIPSAEFQPSYWAAFSMNWKKAVGLVWLSVVLGLFIRLARAFRTIRKAFHVLQDASDPDAARLLHQCAGQIGLKRVPRLASAEAINSPLVFGFLNPVIIIPDYLLKPDQSNRLRFTLLHEMTHLQRKDNWWLIPEFLTKTFFFFHPVVYWASKRLHEELEILCDRTVIEHTQQRAPYAEYLLQETWKSVNQTQRAFALPFISRASATSRRVRQILYGKGATTMDTIRNTFALSIVSLIVVSFFLFTTVPNATGQAASGGSSSAVQSTSGSAAGSQTWQSQSGSGTTGLSQSRQFRRMGRIRGMPGYGMGMMGGGLPARATGSIRVGQYTLPDGTTVNMSMGFMNWPHDASGVPIMSGTFTDTNGAVYGFGTMGMPKSATGVPMMGGFSGMGMGMMGAGMGSGGMMGIPQPATGVPMMGGYGGMGGGMGMMGAGMGGGMMGASQPVQKTQGTNQDKSTIAITVNKDIIPDTLEVEIGNRKAKRGVDYLYDEREHILLFLNTNKWPEKQDYKVWYKLKDEDGNPGALEIKGNQTGMIMIPEKKEIKQNDTWRPPLSDKVSDALWGIEIGGFMEATYTYKFDDEAEGISEQPSIRSRILLKSSEQGSSTLTPKEINATHKYEYDEENRKWRAVPFDKVADVTPSP